MRPGTARHMSGASAGVARGDDGELAEAQPPVVGWHQAVYVRAEAPGGQRADDRAAEDGVREHATAQHDVAAPVRLAEEAAHAHDGAGDARVEAARDAARVDAAADVAGDLAHQR